MVDAAPGTVRLRGHVESFRGLLRDDRKQAIGVLSYEQLALLLRERHEHALADWIEVRIATVGPR